MAGAVNKSLCLDSNLSKLEMIKGKSLFCTAANLNSLRPTVTSELGLFNCEIVNTNTAQIKTA